MTRLDFKYVAGMALNRAMDVLEHWLPDGKREGKEYVALNPTRADSGRHSFSVNTVTGVWSDFATGDKGGDLIDLVAYVDGCSKGDAKARLSKFLGLSGMADGEKPPPSPVPATKNKAPGSTFHAIFPVPDDKWEYIPDSHPTLGKPSATWEYADQDKKLLMAVMRFDIDRNGKRGKEYRPLCYGSTNANSPKWTWKQPTDNRPLYNLDLLGDSDGQPVLLCEGEKAADKADGLLSDADGLVRDAIPMAWPSGSKAIGKVDFSPLAGREVWYWPDNDQAGKESVSVLEKALNAVGVTCFKVADLGFFNRFAPSTGDDGKPLLIEGSPESDIWPEKADAADAVEMGWTREHFALLVDKGLFSAPPKPQQKARKGDTKKGEHEGAPEPVKSRFVSSERGLMKYDPTTECFQRIGGRLDVLALSRNNDGRSWGVLVSFDDRDGVVNEWSIPASLLATEGGADVIKELLDRGYQLAANRSARKLLLEYLGDYETENRVTLVNRMGWYDSTAFVSPNKVYGLCDESLRHYSDSLPLCKTSEKGCLDDWIANVSKPCMGNDLAVFALSVAFASPLLGMVDSESVGVHFYGTSSLGKSTLLQLASSVYGHPDKYFYKWHATSNALEGIASAHSDHLLVLDEIGQADPARIGEAIYMLASGQGKARANSNGSSRGVEHHWRLVFLSSGEKSLLDHMLDAGKSPQAGMEVRLLTVPASFHDDPIKMKNMGVFQDVKGFSSGADFSAHLLEQARKYHGVPFAKFLEFLTGCDRAELSKKTYAIRDEVKTELHIDGGGQIARAADKFALIAAAGEYATLAGLTGWAKGDAIKAIKACFDNWVSFRGTKGNLEDKQAVDHVKSMLVSNGRYSFERWDGDGSKIDEHSPRIADCLGYRKTEKITDFHNGDGTDAVFYLLLEGFKKLCSPYPYKKVARLLKDMGALEVGGESGRLTKKVRVPMLGGKPVNCYVIRASALFAEGEQPERNQAVEDF